MWKFLRIAVLFVVIVAVLVVLGVSFDRMQHP